MAPIEDDDPTLLLSAKTPVKIAQLGPDLVDQPSQIVRGEITITWPFNSLTNAFAFILAESDVRLRRQEGQVRVHLRGSSAKCLAATQCGPGDELILSLSGVEWAKDSSPGRAPGVRVGWELRFAETLVAQVCVT